MAELWSHQEIVEELERKLLYITLELDSARMEVNEQIKRSKEEVNQLRHHLDLAYRERDEAREEIQKLMIKLKATPIPVDIPSFESDSPSLNQPRTANSSITESNSFFHGVPSPAFSNSSMAESNNLGFGNQPDPAYALMDSLVKGKTLPEQGKLLQSVMEAGPLLQTLLLAEPLPRCRIPPPNGPKQLNSYLEICREFSPMCSASKWKFSHGSSSSSSASWFASFNSQILSGKRPRFH